MKDSKSSTLRHRSPYDALRDPALWAWLIVALLAMIPARGALHLILA
jgi:hypothetical protein